ncbi:MAG: zinc ribbon domain-containing protein [Bacilli bacterium]|nr:zinc ribbon domain-containing protein [Bacilli bacterium]
MYCRNCGTYNEEEANYCSECGFLLKDEKIETKKEKSSHQTKEKKPKGNKKSFLSKKHKKSKDKNNRKKDKVKNKEVSKERKSKTGLFVFLLMILLLGSTYYYFNKVTTKEEIAKKYFTDKMSGDPVRMYAYYEVEESPFTTKNMYKKLTEDKREETPEIKSYRIAETKESSDGLTATVTISYRIKGSTQEYTETILLSKKEEKRYLIFDTWELSKNTYKTVSNFKVTVMKDAVLSLEGQKVDKKYIEKSISTDTVDAYVLPALFASNYQAKVDLPYGFSITEEINPNSYIKSKSLLLTKENMPEASKNKLVIKAKEDLKEIYESALAKKEYSEIASLTNPDKIETSLEKEYTNLVENLNQSDTTLNEIKFTDIAIGNTESTKEGYVRSTLRAQYTYTVTYKENEEEKTSTKQGTSSIVLTFTCKDNQFYTIGVENLPNSFRK